jgi:energy-coupling factor transporter ATP-binding protein EcfA2
MARVLLGLDYSTPVALKIVASADGVHAVASFTTASQRSTFVDLLDATYAGAEVDDFAPRRPGGGATVEVAFAPLRPDYIPLASKPVASSLSNLLAVCCRGLSPDEVATFSVHLQSARTKGWSDRAEDLGKTIIKRIDLGSDTVRALFGFSSSQAAERQIGESIVTKSQAKLLVGATLCFAVVGPDRGRASAIVDRVSAAVRSFNGALMNPLTVSTVSPRRPSASAVDRRSFIATPFEVAVAWGLPGRADNAPSSMYVSVRRLAAPFAVPSSGVVIGRDVTGRSVAIAEADFPLHGALSGRTGSGKSTVLARLAVALAERGYALIVVDPKDGSLLELVVANLSDIALEQCILIDAADPDYVVGLPPLRRGDNVPDYLLAADMASTFEKMLGAYWSPRIEATLVAAFQGCLALGLTSLTMIWPVLTDPPLRRAAIAALRDPLVVDTLRELDAMTPAARSTRLASIRNRLSVLLSNPAARDIIGQSAGLDLGAVISQGGVVLARLPSGLIGEDAAGTLGSMLITMAQHAVHGRLGRTGNRPVALLADEAQRFTTRALVRLLAEARAFGLSVFLASQYVGQLTDDIRDALLANASLLAQFAASPAEVRLWHGRFAPFTPEDVVNLPRFQAATSVPAGAERPPAFTLMTVPLPVARDPERWARVRVQTIERYARRRADVQAELESLAHRGTMDPSTERPDVDVE